ncbi:MAG: molybdenum cofactor biosynthesis protein MoaE [Planctomycetia bacterium]|jgi:molybdopterin synthase catalytic subunit|nr:molybdenum cofactor biosynthesis protein MoaE [Planctomycetia bacterium]
MIELTTDTIDVARVIEAVRSPKAGAVVLFLGTARESTGGRAVRSLEYEAYDAMARAELARLEAQARATWDLVDCAIVHRLGEVAVGQTSVAIAVSAAHREGAFEAGRWLIDRIKEVVPIWKKENRADGSADWVHPMIDLPGA